MKTIRNIASLAAVAVLAAVFAAVPTNAQDLTGEFTLPLQARWGTANLQPGEYDLRVTLMGGIRILHVRSQAPGSQGESFVLAIHERTRRGAKNALVCIRYGSTAVVRALELGALGQTYYFSTPKEAELYGQDAKGKKPTLRAEASKLVRVPVRITGK
jgi:hypothetical protein